MPLELEDGCAAGRVSRYGEACCNEQMEVAEEDVVDW